MPPRKEPCRNFIRGSCQYGDRCKFLHVAPQQSKPNSFGFGMQNQQQQQKPNPFGFGMQNQQQQQKPNPFGFGTQNLQPRGANDFGSKQNQSKPFENKWTRPSPANNNNSSTASRQPDNQTPAPAHKCTDPESCKREIVEDLKNERPMWKLTCYGHYKNGPCDIVGDVSYEEMRAAAYDDAKRGLNMQSIVERERNLLQAKVGEFESLARNPYAVQSNPAPSSQNPFTRGTPNPVTAPSSGPLLSSFSQFGSSVNTTSGISSAAPPSNNLFGQQNPFSNLSAGPPSNNLFAPPNSFQNLGERSGSFGANNTIFGTAGTLTSQMTPATPQSPFSVISAEQNAFSTSAIPPQISNTADNRLPNSSNGIFGNTTAVGQSTVNIQLTNDVQRGNGDGDESIWMKNAWRRGEIPEEAPPDKYLY